MIISIEYSDNRIDRVDIDSFEKDVVSFGRNEDCDVVIDKPYVSRLQGCFYKENGIWNVKNLSNRNNIRWFDEASGESHHLNERNVSEGLYLIIKNGKTKENVTIQILSVEALGSKKNIIEDGDKKDTNQKGGISIKNKKLFISLVAVAVVLLATIIVIIVMNNRKKTPTFEAVNDEDYVDYGSNTDAYFKDNSTVISVVDADKSNEVHTEKDVQKELGQRGFDQFYVYTDYGIDGESYEEDQQVEDTQDKHPSYETYYMNKKEEMWTIFVINGRVMANPVSYNLDSDLGVQVIFSESESVMSYDCYHNKFYETIPNQSELYVIQVDKIDSATLDDWTVKKIEKHVK
ncbi:MAG: FHA domain-containing protein [Eubacterium sp.]|nr:FHA domain-containing protein [Eubacterium sp.]